MQEHAENKDYAYMVLLMLLMVQVTSQRKSCWPTALIRLTDILTFILLQVDIVNS